MRGGAEPRPEGWEVTDLKGGQTRETEQGEKGLSTQRGVAWSHAPVNHCSGQLGHRTGASKEQQETPDGRCWPLPFLLTRVPISSPLQLREESWGGGSKQRDQS